MPIYEIGAPPADPGDEEINRLLSKAREVSGHDWRVGLTVIPGRWPWSSDEEKWRLLIYESKHYESALVYVAGARREIVAYLLGIIDGANSPAAAELSLEEAGAFQFVEDADFPDEISRVFRHMAYDREQDVFLCEYAGIQRVDVLEQIMQQARLEGFDGTGPERLEELGWRILRIEIKPTKDHTDR